MRPWRRRCPAGTERVPTEVLVPEIVEHHPGPVLLRLGPGRGLLDYPVRWPVTAVANVWPVDDGWAEAAWPRDPSYGWFVAPIDLRAGHVLEFRGTGLPVVGGVAAVDEVGVVVVIEPSRARAGDVAAWVQQVGFRSRWDRASCGGSPSASSGDA